MALFSHEFNSLNDLFLEQLRDLYDAEQRLTDALPKMADAACTPELSQAFRQHESQTQEHARRLEDIFRKMGQEPQRVTCEAMKGLLKEGQGMIGAKGNDSVRDAALIGAAQKVEHYEMATYGAARTYARELGLTEIAQILQRTLEEEGQTDKRLTEIAENNVNLQAVH